MQNVLTVINLVRKTHIGNNIYSAVKRIVIQMVNHQKFPLKLMQSKNMQVVLKGKIVMLLIQIAHKRKVSMRKPSRKIISVLKLKQNMISLKILRIIHTICMLVKGQQCLKKILSMLQYGIIISTNAPNIPQKFQ